MPNGGEVEGWSDATVVTATQGEGGGVVIAVVVAMAGLMAALVLLEKGIARFVGGGR
jgi:hypothetical protein